jgi:hypothetical protein
MLTAAATLMTATIGAGGWAVVTIDDLPARIEAARPLTLAFTVRQHGMTLLDGLKASIEATSGGLNVSAPAAAAQPPGHYAATIVLPRPGEWVVTIRSGFGDSRLTLLPVTVVAAGAPAPVLARADLGRHLFVAKGCVTCHQNDVDSSNRSLRLAPLLIPDKYQDSFLSRILANPAAALPPRAGFPQMPNLNLQPGEISALVAFINSGNRALTR